MILSCCRDATLRRDSQLLLRRDLSWCWDMTVVLNTTLIWSWDATVMLKCNSQWRRSPHFDTTLALNLKVTLRVSRHGCPLNANIVLDTCLAQIELEIRATNQGHWGAYKKARGLSTVIHFNYLLHQTRIWRIFKALELSEEPKAFKLFSTFFKDQHRQMAPKSKNITSSSGTVVATTLMNGAPP